MTLKDRGVHRVIILTEVEDDNTRRLVQVFFPKPGVDNDAIVACLLNNNPQGELIISEAVIVEQTRLVHRE